MRVLALLSPLWIALAQAAPAGPPPVRFALRIAIASDATGQPVTTPEWLAAQLAQADALFAPFGVGFVRQDAPPLAAAAEHIETRADRDALSARVVPRVINVFVVGSLRDVDEPGRMRRGVHWHASARSHYVIIVGTAPPTVLAHELGHYFGNPHSPVPDNVMSYERTGGPVSFDAAQGQRIGRAAGAYVRSRELEPVGP
ncbi:MAG: hypothetical protein JOZ69_14115 [Myxococcales bacterium]|nr:hypothetical protein [Myxococcales bacterium]